MEKYKYTAWIGAEEERAVAKVLRSKQLSIYNSKVVYDFEKELAKTTNHKYAIATNTGTAALHSILIAIGITKGDEVIVQGINYVSVILSVLYCNATPIFADINSATKTMEWEQIKPLVTKKTKAIIVSSLFGLMPSVRKISEKAKALNILVIEDMSQSYGSKLNNKFYSIRGDVGFYSFSESKNITTSEGGAVVTNSYRIANEVRKSSQLGQFYKGTDKACYPNPDFSKDIEQKNIGFTYRMSPILAAIGKAQLNRSEKIFAKRKKIASIYKELLSKIDNIEFPQENKQIDCCYNTFLIQIKDVADSDIIQSKCLAKGLPILKAFYCETLDYEIFKDFINLNNLKNSLSFKKNNLVIPIYIDKSINESRKFIKEFVTILKEEEKC